MSLWAAPDHAFRHLGREHRARVASAAAVAIRVLPRRVAPGRVRSFPSYKHLQRTSVNVKECSPYRLETLGAQGRDCNASQGAAHAAAGTRFISRATIFKSRMKASFCWCLDSSSRARKIDDGCTVAMTRGAREDGMNWPRRRITLKSGPSKACAAVAPRHTIASGRVTAISASSQGRQARISE
jgi:hypothetical protein